MGCFWCRTRLSRQPLASVSLADLRIISPLPPPTRLLTGRERQLNLGAGRWALYRFTLSLSYSIPFFLFYPSGLPLSAFFFLFLSFFFPIPVSFALSLSFFLPFSLFFSKSLSLSLHLLFLSLPLFLSPYPSLSQHLSLHPFSSMQRKRKWGMNVQGIGCSDNPLKSRFLKCSFEIPSKCSRTPLHSIPCSDCYISIRNFTYSFSQLFKRVSWNYCSISQNCKHTWTIPRWQFPMMVLPRHLVLVKLNPASSMNMYPWGKALASGSNILWKKRKWPYQTIGQNTGTLRCMATCLYRVLKGCGQLQ